MKVSNIINRLKDTRGFINESTEHYSGTLEEDEMKDFDFMLEGLDEAIQFFEEWLLTNEDFTE
jgi:hypothetical protein